MKKILFVFLDLLSIAFLAGGYAIQYFTKRKLGMVRWVVFKNKQLQEQMPVDVLKYAAAAFVLILAVFTLAGFLKKKAHRKKPDVVMAIFMAALTAGYLGFTILASENSIRSYYLVMPMIGAAALLQVIRNMIAVRTCKYEK